MPVWHVAAHGVVGVTTSSRVKLGWEVPDDRWAEFTEKVEEEWGESRLYAGVQIEQSWREYRDVHPLEDHANRLLEAAGLSRETDEKKNLPGVPSLADTESSRQFVRVHEDVKQEMEQYAAAHGLSKHEVLRGVIAWYLGGSREERLVEKFDRVVPEAERAFAEATDDGPETADGLSKSERVTRKIARSLGDSFSENDLEDAIDAETTGTDYYHDEYTPRVVEYKGVKRWEKGSGPDIFLPPETWRAKQTTEIVSELGGDYETPPPAFTRQEFAQAADRAGIEVSPENRETVNEYKDRVLDRIEFAWSEETEQFEPVDDPDAETGSAPPTDDVEATDDGDVDADADTEPVTVTDRMDDLEGATQIRADGGVVTDSPPADAGPVAPPDPAPTPETDADADDEDSVRLLTPTCPTDGQMLSADAHRDGREWECPCCRQRWTPSEVFPSDV
ncbi:hypothetical protein SAMN05443574_13511 [Haloarcula vallismortis]|uniref:Uncharacterized protein n=2 Tax=Haloarcula vallismortis TaxID=28442 RepID=M0J5N8_HALVA|nr:hypothetical protein [Haloarcula vallismortis]EMA04286.1 hypothetical protein C437_14037 [Haloarcula vallismortis ATCC 29715]SDX35437.1 hypothetical protein SAMN05443574_13511 [Haloarcula vallismortis]